MDNTNISELTNLISNHVCIGRDNCKNNCSECLATYLIAHGVVIDEVARERAER